MFSDIQQTVLTQQQIADLVARLGEQISRDYAHKNLLLVGVLRGAVVFFADLMRAITIPCRIDFIEVSSYGDGTSSSGTITLRKDVKGPLAGFDILLVEDMLDSGNTISYLRRHFQDCGAASVKCCVLLDKQSAHAPGISAEYVGTCAPDGFLVGYGLDFAQNYRHLPYIGILRPQVYQGQEHT